MTADTHNSTAPSFENQTLAAWGQRPMHRMLMAGGIGLVVALILGVLDASWHGTSLLRLSVAFLVSFCFFLSISLGALCFVMLQHLTRAGWSVVVRRLAEYFTAGFMPLALLFLPILLAVLFGSSIPFVWNGPEALENPLIRHKAPYLNWGFFTIRAIAYFAIWIFLSRWLLSLSLKQDETGSPELTNRAEGLSAPGLFLFALSLTFAAFDWLMSLDPEWFSTIFGVYYFSGSMMSFLAALGLVVMFLQGRGLLTNAVTVEHRHDIAKLMFGFICFWAYIAFSQYMLIWYSNIPEETTWYQPRQQNGWEYVSMALILGHFVLPFVGFISRHMKRNATVFAGWAIAMLVMHWIDLYWLVYPNFEAFHVPPFGLIEIASLIGVGGIWLGGILYFVGNKPLIALRDPRLSESLAFHNI